MHVLWKILNALAPSGKALLVRAIDLSDGVEVSLDDLFRAAVGPGCEIRAPHFARHDGSISAGRADEEAVFSPRVCAALELAYERTTKARLWKIEVDDILDAAAVTLGHLPYPVFDKRTRDLELLGPEYQILQSCGGSLEDTILKLWERARSSQTANVRRELLRSLERLRPLL